MSQLEKLIEIDADPSSVFAVFGDQENVPRWLPSVSGTKLIEGNRSLWTLAANGSSTLFAEVVERRAPEFIRWRITSEDMQGTQSVTSISGHLVETRAGHTILRLAFGDDDSAHLPAALNMLLLRADTSAATEQTLARSLAEFKQHVELSIRGTTNIDTTQSSAVLETQPPVTAKDSVQVDDSARVSELTHASDSTRAGEPIQAGEAPQRINFIQADNPLPVTAPRAVAKRAEQAERAGQANDDVTVIRHSSRHSPQSKPTLPAHAATHPSPRVSRTLSPVRTILFAALAFGILAFVILWLKSRTTDAPDATATESARAATSNSLRQSAAETNTAEANTNEMSVAGLRSEESDTKSNRSTAADSADAATQSDVDSTRATSKRAAEPDAAVLRTALDEWVAATNAADLNRQSQFYAASLERYYRRSNFARSEVEKDKSDLMRRSRLSDVNIQDSQITVSPDNRTAIMRFRKNYSFAGKPGTNAVLQELRWRKTEDGWRIISERDLRVLR